MGTHIGRQATSVGPLGVLLNCAAGACGIRFPGGSVIGIIPCQSKYEPGLWTSCMGSHLASASAGTCWVACRCSVSEICAGPPAVTGQVLGAQLIGTSRVHVSMFSLSKEHAAGDDGGDVAGESVDCTDSVSRSHDFL